MTMSVPSVLDGRSRNATSQRTSAPVSDAALSACATKRDWMATQAIIMTTSRDMAGRKYVLGRVDWVTTSVTA
jgi:hypothetical protein